MRTKCPHSKSLIFEGPFLVFYSLYALVCIYACNFVILPRWKGNQKTWWCMCVWFSSPTAHHQIFKRQIASHILSKNLTWLTTKKQVPQHKIHRNCYFLKLKIIFEMEDFNCHRASPNSFLWRPDLTYSGGFIGVSPQSEQLSRY